VSFDAFFIGVLTGLDLAHHLDTPALLSVLPQHLGEAGNECLDLMPVRTLLPLLSVLPPLGRGDAKPGSDPALGLKGLDLGA
jgi:hypothetical protein